MAKAKAPASKPTKTTTKRAPARRPRATAPKKPAPTPSVPAPQHPLHSLRQEIDRVFEDFSSGFPRFPMFGRGLLDREPWSRLERAAGMLVPEVDVSEDDKEYRVTAELPGMTEDDIEVTLSDNMLTVKGEKKEEKEEKRKDYFMSERRYGSFRRSFQVPPSVDESKIGASMKNGVLTVTLPKSAAAKGKAKKIEVKR